MKRLAVVVVSTLLASGALAAGGETHSWDKAAGDVKNTAGKPDEAAFHPLERMSTDVEILYGDPAVAGKPFVMRIHELPGSIVPPHTHPVDENITVVKGTWYFGFGKDFDKKALKALPVGSYAFAPHGSTMFAYAEDDAIVQIHGIGPFEIHWLHGAKTLADANAVTVFHFRKGEAVKTSRGAGRIRDGYVSGQLIEYEIEAANGERFMSQESALARQ